MSVLLLIFFIFSENLFLRSPLEGSFLTKHLCDSVFLRKQVGNYPASNYMLKVNNNPVAKLVNGFHRAGICLVKVNNRNTRTRCEICSKLTIKTPEWRHWVKTVNYFRKRIHQKWLVVSLNILSGADPALQTEFVQFLV